MRSLSLWAFDADQDVVAMRITASKNDVAIWHICENFGIRANTEIFFKC